MPNSNTKQKTGARESGGLQACADSAPPQGTSRTCNDCSASLSITAHANYNEYKKITPLRFAVDSLYLSYKGDINPEIESLLTNLKETAQSEDKDLASNAYLEIHGHKFEVSPKGSSQFAFLIKDNWFSIKLSKTKKSDKSQVPLAHVQISSELLTFTPLYEITEHLNRLVQQLGNVQSLPTISRLDLCLDFMARFDIEKIHYKQWKTRATKTNPFYEHKKLTGWQIGSGHIMGRLYNKLLEITKSKKDYLLPLWSANGWDGESQVWRLEFQTRREFLKHINLNSPNQIMDMSPALWKYATEKWLQLVTPTNDSNETRWPVTEEWLEISQACTNPHCSIVKPVKKQRMPNDHYLFKNGLAAISSLMAREGISDLGEGIGTFLHMAREFHKTEEELEQYLVSKAKQKALKYNTRLEE